MLAEGVGHPCLEQLGEVVPLFLDRAGTSSLLRVIYGQNMTNLERELTPTSLLGSQPPIRRATLLTDWVRSIGPRSSLCTPSIDQSHVATLNFLTVIILGQAFEVYESHTNNYR